MGTGDEEAKIKSRAAEVKSLLKKTLAQIFFRKRNKTYMGLRKEIAWPLCKDDMHKKEKEREKRLAQKYSGRIKRKTVIM